MRTPTPRRSPRRSARLALIEKLEDRHAMAVFMVTNVNDSGDGSLRNAILQANALSGPDRIEFNIGSASKTIALQTALPWLDDTTELDASTQPGFVDRPIVELDGTAVTAADVAGIVVDSNNSLVRGLTINNFDRGIVIQFSSGSQVIGNHVGIDSAGTTAIGNRKVGIYVIDSSFNAIGGSSSLQRNVISGNGEHGVRLTGGSVGNRIQGNYIGTNAAALAAVPNRLDGILVGDGATNTIIGADSDGKEDAAEGNIIAGNLLSGVNLNSTVGNFIAGNRIGIGADAHTQLGNGGDGIHIAGDSSLNWIGTTLDGVSDDLEANVIASNKRNGIRINNSRANSVSGNYIGLLGDGVTGSPNLESGVLIDGGSIVNTVGTKTNGRPEGRNVISANGLYGVWISGSSLNSVLGNVIGRTADDQNMLTNTLAGVRLTSASGNEVGLTPTLFNRIGYLTEGIRVDGDSQTNVLNYNSYIGSATALPIDLGGDGLTANDTDDVDTGPNALQNFPVVQLVTQRGIITGTINSRPYRVYQIQLYTSGLSSDGVNIEYDLLRRFSVQTDGLGNADWMIDTLNSIAVDRAITAIAYDLEAGTSEFSADVQAKGSRQVSVSSNPVLEQVGSVTGSVFRATSDGLSEVVVTLQSSDATRATVPAQVTIPAGEQSAQFTITVLDDQAVHYDQLIITAETELSGGAFELTISDNDNPWHNYRAPLDVSGDGRLSAFDALLIINGLNNGRNGSLLNRTTEFPPVFFDVNNDDNLTAFDALQIINALNNGLPVTGEGEGPVTDSSTWNVGSMDDFDADSQTNKTGQRFRTRIR